MGTNVPQSESSMKKLLYTIIGSLLGVVFAAVVGDVLIKRNVDIYHSELRQIRSDLADLYSDFTSLDADIVAAVDSRRSLSQEMNRYIASGDVRNATSRYEAYMNTVRSWANRAIEIRSRIQSITYCNSPWPDQYELGTRLESVVLQFSKGRSFNLPDMDLTCPDVVLFSGRSDAPGSEKDFRSVFEVFRYIHLNIASSVSSSVLSCAAAAQSMYQDEVRGCRGSTARLWEYHFPDVPQCMERAARNYSPDLICRTSGFGRSAGIGDDRFQRLDSWWDLGRRLLKAYRLPRIARTCDERLNGWARIVGPNCEQLLAELKL